MCIRDRSTSVCGAEVQKGNAPTERKLQRDVYKRQVEEELGITVFMRNNRGITVTAEGEEFLG